MSKRYARNVKDYPRPDHWRKLPDGGHPKTCPATRHAAMICDSFRDARSPVRSYWDDRGQHGISSTLLDLVRAG